MSKFIIRLDDACEYMNLEKWKKIESLLNRYGVKPIVGVIPHCEDIDLKKYPKINNIWEIVEQWKLQGWCIAMHGYNHVYSSADGGINPVHNRSEFAGESLSVQREKIRLGYLEFCRRSIFPEVFFAPSHTFDENTLIALNMESNIRVISDSIANDVYCRNGIYFIPQQCGQVRLLPFKVVTFCYHPNTMENFDFEYLENFLQKYNSKFISYDDVCFKYRKCGIYDNLLKKLYFLKRQMK